MAISLSQVLAALPRERPVPPHSPEAKVVVLDDDPTGTQTMHGIVVLTEWSVTALAAELTAPGSCFYILTNTRAVAAPAARAINLEIGRNLVAASRQTRAPYRVVSRSDSTLRGHFPLEIEALVEALGGNFDARFIIPAFFEGGRFTIGDIHYVADQDALIPAGETEFARDATFGYRASNLRDWVEEKTGGRVPASQVSSISILELRNDPAPLVARLSALSGGTVVVVNAVAPADLGAFTAALAVAERRGRRFIYRSAASFVAAYAGIAPHPLLTPGEIAGPGKGGGLVVAGSYVGKTSAQLAQLFRGTDITPVEIAVEKLRAAGPLDPELTDTARRIDGLLRHGGNVAVYTSRELVTGGNAADSLAIGEAVSRGLVRLVATLTERPRWLIAKGGITSSDLATRALGVRRALVLGQALPGVPVWRLGPESRWPGLAYVVFPGNVGSPESLRQLVASLQ